jgi:hypothetical protein
MNFGFTEGQNFLRSEARGFLAERCPPAENDRDGCLYAFSRWAKFFQ